MEIKNVPLIVTVDRLKTASFDATQLSIDTAVTSPPSGPSVGKEIIIRSGHRVREPKLL